ncbi:MAG: hypothetical protein QFB87_00420 [Patescibacteria group bacterium]|nr:hypothetical protein [Patescibacteria group bacterium]
MFLQYRTGLATLVQFISLCLLGILNTADSVISTCTSHHSTCISNLLVSVIFYLLMAAWFGGLWVIGYSAQERRSRRLALLLIGLELLVLLVAAFNAQHHANFINLLTSAIDSLLAIWVILLAWRLSRSKGGRIVSSQQARQRRHPPTSL